jgi:hypothetical protein
MFRVEGLWKKEPNNLGIPHVVILDSARAMQSVFVQYDTTYFRLVGQPKFGLTVDAYGAASTLATSSNQRVAARQYDYYNAIGLLGSGRTTDAVIAYNRFCASSPSGQLSREEYDNFPVHQACMLSLVGKTTEAIAALREVPSNAGQPSYQANIQLALAGLLCEGGNRAEARSIYSNIQKRIGISDEIKNRCAFALANSYAKEIARDSLEWGKKLLVSFISTTQNQTYKRSALLALANAEGRLKNTKGIKSALKQVASMGTSQQRLAAKMQLLDLQFSEEDYPGTHSMCKWILANGQSGRHLPHLLYLDAVALKRIGKAAESGSQLKRLCAEFPGNAYAAYAAAALAAPVLHRPAADSQSKGAAHQ